MLHVFLKNRVQYNIKNYYKCISDSAVYIYNLLKEIGEDIIQLGKDTLKYFSNSLDVMDAFYAKKLKKFLAQTDEHKRRTYNKIRWEAKCTIVFIPLIIYYRDSQSYMNIDPIMFIPYEELKIILPPIVEGPVWNENLGKLYISETPSFYLDPNLITKLSEELIEPFNFLIGIDWFLC